MTEKKPLETTAFTATDAVHVVDPEGDLYVLGGRIPGDDDDTAMVIKARSGERAIQAFEDALWACEKSDTRRETEELEGAAIYLNVCQQIADGYPDAKVMPSLMKAQISAIADGYLDQLGAESVSDSEEDRERIETEIQRAEAVQHWLLDIEPAPAQPTEQAPTLNERTAPTQRLYELPVTFDTTASAMVRVWAESPDEAAEIATESDRLTDVAFSWDDENVPDEYYVPDPNTIDEISHAQEARPFDTPTP